MSNQPDREPVPSRPPITSDELEFLKQFGTPVPGLPRSKEFRETKENRKPEYEASDFRPEDNIDLILGADSGDVDLDAAEAVQIADHFLPRTGAVFGRAGKPRSHRLYRCEIERSLKLVDTFCEDTKKATLVELRTNGDMTVFPPSIHPNGELVEWDTRDDRSPVDSANLIRAVRLLAVAAVVARYYPASGTRHDPFLCLAGALRQLGVTREEAEKIFVASAAVARDAKADDRLAELRTTYAKSETEAIAGLGQLKQHSPEIGKQLAKLLDAKSASVLGFICDENGKKLTRKPHNIRHALKLLNIRPVFDTFRRGDTLRFQDRERLFEDRPLDEVWFKIEEQFGFLPEETLFRKVVRSEAFRNFFHPVLDYLSALTWDGTPRIDEWLIRYCKAEDTKLNQAIGSIVLRAAVARIYEPGKKFDELLVLMSPQGWNKSTAVQALCPNPDWFLEGLPIGVDSKVVIERTLGKWIIEANELRKSSGASDESIKAFLSTTADTARLSYEREPVTVKRHWVAIGTCNPGDILTDTTGNRRWWIVEVGKIDVETLIRDRDQLWAEARERRSEPIRLDESLYQAAAEVQEEHRGADPWEDAVRIQLGLDSGKVPEAYRKKHTDGTLTESNEVRISNDELFTILGLSSDRRKASDEMRLGKVMRTLQFEKTRVRRGEKTRHGWKLELNGQLELPENEEAPF